MTASSSDVPAFCSGLPSVPDDLVEALSHLLVDHHVHGTFLGAVNRARFEEAINEGSTGPIPDYMTQFDSQVGIAIRRWCAPLLGLPRHAAPDDYWHRRSELDDSGVARALLPAAGVRTWLVDTGWSTDRLTSPETLANWAGGGAKEILRLESLAESLVMDDVSPRHYAQEFRSRLADLGPSVVGVKSIVGYRCGFDIDWARPSEAQVAAAVAAWAEGMYGTWPRLTSPVLAVFGIHAAADAGLPIQLHVGIGDRDLDLHRVDPMLLLPLLRLPSIQRVPIPLLHCYPYHRQAGYLAQAFDNVYFDVGLASSYLGARATELLAESLELAPFAKQLYSSDGYGPPELHLLGSVLWRRGMARVLGRWLLEGDWSLPDAIRVVRMIGSDNAQRVYQL